MDVDNELETIRKQKLKRETRTNRKRERWKKVIGEAAELTEQLRSAWFC